MYTIEFRFTGSKILSSFYSHTKKKQQGSPRSAALSPTAASRNHVITSLKAKGPPPPSSTSTPRHRHSVGEQMEDGRGVMSPTTNKFKSLSIKIENPSSSVEGGDEGTLPGPPPTFSSSTPSGASHKTVFTPLSRTVFTPRSAAITPAPIAEEGEVVPQVFSPKRGK